MRPDEVRAFGNLAGDAAVGLATQIRDVHRAVAGRVFGLLGAPAAPARVLHDAIAGGVYASVRGGSSAVVRGGAFAAAVTRGEHAPSILENPRGRMAVGAINGAWGDRLRAARSVLEEPMSVRVDGRDVPADPAALAAAFPAASDRIAVFIHGLGETEAAWRLRAQRSAPYGERMTAEFGYTAVYVNYNTGLHISHNGRALSVLLDALVDAWPVPVAEIALIGHSMGGLVARGACHYAAEGGWRERVRHVVTLGSPHKGAPLELVANAACHALSQLPETRPFATPIKARSAGVKDLGYGYVVDADWKGHDPDAFWTNTGTVVPFLESANHYFVSATLTRDAEHPVGRLIGDLLVLRASAWSHDGRGERLQFDLDRYSHIGGASHFDLLNHPGVYAQLRRWLGSERALPASV